MIRNRMIQYKNRLFRINDEEPLSKLSLCVIIALDLFILFMVFSGLDEHTKQLISPIDYVPYECREVFISHNWTHANRMAKLQQMVLKDYHHYSYRYSSAFGPTRIKQMHPVCREFFDKIQSINKDKPLFELFKQREKLGKAKTQLTSGFKESKDVYDTSLLENIAETGPEKNNLPSISNAMKEKGQQIEVYNSRIFIIENQINAHEKIKDLWAFIQADASGRRGLLVKDLKRVEFWHPFKELCWQLLFLLPLFLFFICGTCGA